MEPVPLARLVLNFSSIPRTAPPPLGSDSTGSKLAEPSRVSRDGDGAGEPPDSPTTLSPGRRRFSLAEGLPIMSLPWENFGPSYLLRSPSCGYRGTRVSGLARWTSQIVREL